MIVVKLQGGLGNQLFQWAFGKNLSILNNTKLYLDSNFYKVDIPGVTKRVFSLNKFPFLDYNLTDTIESNNKKFLRITEESFLNIEYDNSYNYYLDGYFQSEKFFIESSDLIKNLLRPSDDVSSMIKCKYSIVDSSISMHIRRTDYVTSNGYHPVQSIEYYKEAIEIIGDYNNIFIFSDDINWCKENLKFDNMVFVDGNDDVEDLWIMSMCNHNIIANSSFSWWGAWLNNNPDKKIIAPKKWFGDSVNINSNEIIPDEWIKI